jgi:hypothetical protein
VELCKLGLQCRAGRKHRAYHRLEHGLAGHEIEDPRLEATAADRADLEAKAAQHPANAALDVEQLAWMSLRAVSSDRTS